MARCRSAAATPFVARRLGAAYHAAVGDSHDSRAWDIEGPIRAEIFLVRLGLRHLAWLVQDDPAVAERLAPGWRDPLADYAPEPFRSFS